MNKPKVSIIMPVHNTGIYLKECLESVFHQTFCDFELICVDDCSRDEETKRILKEYSLQHCNMAIIMLEQNVGAGEARNIGFARAQGEYVIFLDADDIFAEDMLKLMYEKACLENAEVCLCGYQAFWMEKNEKKYAIPKIPTMEEVLKKNREEWFIRQVYAPWNKLCRKSFLEINKLYFQNLSSSNDVFFSCMVLLKAEKVSIIERALVNYRTNTEIQISTNYNPCNFHEATKLLGRELEQTEKRKKQILVMSLNVGWQLLRNCNNVDLQKKAYTLLKEICVQNKDLQTKDYKSNYLREGFINNSWESKWFIPEQEYIVQLRMQAKKIKDSLGTEAALLLWGLGKRGAAFQQFCKEEKIPLSQVTDQKNDAIGKCTEYGYQIVSTEEAKNFTGIIIASNTQIYEALINPSDTKGRIINLEQYCPL